MSVVGLLGLLEFGSGLLQGWNTSLLGAVGQHFGVSSGPLVTVVSASILLGALLTPLLCKFADRVGHRFMLRLAIPTVAFGAIVSAAAPAYGWYLAGRVIQGVLVVFLPLDFAIVRDRVPERSAVAVGLLVGVLAVGEGSGLVLSGLVMRASNNDLRLTLWVVAIVMCAATAIPFLIPETVSRSAKRIDWWGATLAGGAASTLLFGISEKSNWGWAWYTFLCIAAGCVLFVIWVIVEHRVQEPLYDLRRARELGAVPMFGLAVVAGSLVLGQLNVESVFLGSGSSATHNGFGLDTLQVGLAIIGPTVSLTIVAMAAPSLATRLGVAPALAGSLLLTAVGFGGVILARHELGWFIVAESVATAGGGFLFAAVPVLLLDRAEPGDAAVVGGLYNTTRTTGGSAAGVMFGVILTGITIGTTGAPTGGAFVWVWVACIGLSLVCLPVVAAMRSQLALPAPAG